MSDHMEYRRNRRVCYCDKFGVDAVEVLFVLVLLVKTLARVIAAAVKVQVKDESLSSANVPCVPHESAFIIKFLPQRGNWISEDASSTKLS